MALGLVDGIILGISGTEGLKTTGCHGDAVYIYIYIYTCNCITSWMVWSRSHSIDAD